jgi:hypothetical protein
MIDGEPKCGFDRLLKCVDWFDHMIGGDHCTDRVGIALLQHCGGVSHRGGGIPAYRFTDDIFLRQFRQIFHHQRCMCGVGADINLAGGQNAAQTLVADLQKALATDDSQQLLGSVSTRDGPQSCPRSTSHDHAVLHVCDCIKCLTRARPGYGKLEIQSQKSERMIKFATDRFASVLLHLICRHSRPGRTWGFVAIPGPIRDAEWTPNSVSQKRRCFITERDPPAGPPQREIDFTIKIHFPSVVFVSYIFFVAAAV